MLVVLASLEAPVMNSSTFAPLTCHSSIGLASAVWVWWSAGTVSSLATGIVDVVVVVFVWVVSGGTVTGGVAGGIVVVVVVVVVVVELHTVGQSLFVL